MTACVPLLKKWRRRVLVTSREHFGMGRRQFETGTCNLRPVPFQVYRLEYKLSLFEFNTFLSTGIIIVFKLLHSINMYAMYV